MPALDPQPFSGATGFGSSDPGAGPVQQNTTPVPTAPDPCGLEFGKCAEGGLQAIPYCIALASCRASQAIQNAVTTGIEYAAVILLALFGLYLLFSPEIDTAAKSAANSQGG